jgi:cell wall-associated NlpC family hydrolase
MSFPLRICLLAFVVALTSVAADGALAARKAPSLPELPNPARLEGSVPLEPLPRKRPRKPTLGERAVLIAAQELGVPYRYGGSSPSGFDCSGLTSWVYGQLGIALPHNAAAQYGYGRAVDLARLKPGDLVFFHGLGHVGLYIGHGRIIHAPQSGRNVEIQALTARAGAVEGARRIRF